MVFTNLTDQQVGWLSRIADGAGVDRHDEGFAGFHNLLVYGSK